RAFSPAASSEAPGISVTAALAGFAFAGEAASSAGVDFIAGFRPPDIATPRTSRPTAATPPTAIQRTGGLLPGWAAAILRVVPGVLPGGRAPGRASKGPLGRRGSLPESLMADPFRRQGQEKPELRIQH